MSPSAPDSPSAVPCLAGLYLALGADGDHGAAPAIPRTRRAVAAIAASLLALSVAAWPAAPVASADWLSPVATERPAGTLPEHLDLVPGDVADSE
jgi:hypothetical protein